MKNFIVIAIAFAVFIQAEAASASAQLVSGNCVLESSREIITLKKIDPAMSYGMIAEGFSQAGARIYLTENFAGAVDINIHSADQATYAIVPLRKGKLTPVRTALAVTDSNAKTSQWLSCNLMVK